MKELYKFQGYKEFLQYQIRENSGERGYQGRLAEASGCQKSYFSQVLRSDLHLTLEHGANLAAFWGLDEEETSYFLDLIQLDRAGVPRLREVLKRRLAAAREKQAEPSRRYGSAVGLSEESRQAYYSSWAHAAVHILTGTESFRTAQAISDRLSLPLAVVTKILRELESMGVTAHVGGKWANQARTLHIPKESYLNGVNHNNWRQRAVLDSQRAQTAGLHYTSVQSHSLEDFARIREAVMEAVEKSRKIIGPSPAEDVSVLCLDFFWA
jgi:uncharacterized protein (TIGR02147 family)